MKIKKYHTVRTVPKSNKKNTTLSEQFQNLIEKCHTVRTVPKSNSQRIVISDAVSQQWSKI